MNPLRWNKTIWRWLLGINLLLGAFGAILEFAIWSAFCWLVVGCLLIPPVCRWIVARLKKADTQAEKDAILEELESAADLASLDEMRLPLLEYIQQKTEEAVKEIPMGIHSTRQFNIPMKEFREGGVFLAFKARDKHFWHCYPRIRGHITTDVSFLVDDKGKIFNWIKCQESDFPDPDTLKPVQFDSAIFAVLEGAVRNLLESFKKQRSSQQLKPTLTKQLQKVHVALTQPNLFQEDTTDEETKDRILKVITQVNLKAFERDIKQIWNRYIKSYDMTMFISDLDELFIESELYYKLDEDEQPNTLEMIKEQDIELVCYQWF